MNFTLPLFTPVDLTKVDSRIIPFVTGWSVTETYEGKSVPIPDIVPFNYYEVTDKPADDIQDNEKQLSLWLGWANKPDGKTIIGLYDEEVIINLRIQGVDVLNPIAGKVQVMAEILKSGSAPMQVFYKGKLVTDFTQKVLGFITVANGYQTADMGQYD